MHTDNKYPMEQPICMSMMQKQGKGPVGTWKSRFFVLKERFLWYYKDRKDLFPIDVVLLHKFTVKAHAKVDTRLALATDHSRTYNLKAPLFFFFSFLSLADAFVCLCVFL